MAERITSISTLFFAPYLSAMPPRRGLRTRPAQGMSAKMMPMEAGLTPSWRPIKEPKGTTGLPPIPCSR